MKNLLLLHGALGSKKQFDQLAHDLSNTFHVHTLNFSGHGGLPADAINYSIDLFCRDVRNYLDENGIENTGIFGYSMGGYVAMSLAVKQPQLVQGIFTLATKFDWSPDQAKKETAMLDPEKIVLKIPAFAEELQKRHAPEDWKKVMRKTSEMMILLGDHPLTESDFRKITCPVKISVGDNDKMVSIDSSLKVSQSVPKGSFLVLPNTPHPFEMVDQLKLKSEIESFFTSVYS